MSMRFIPAWRFLAFSLFIAFLNTGWAQPLTVTTIAGQFRYTTYKDGAGTNAFFESPAEMCADQAGNLYLIDGNAIRKIAPDHTVTRLAGIPGYAGYGNGTGTSVLFSYPSGIAVDNKGNVYVADNGNFVVRKMSPLGVVTTLAGNGSPGYLDGAGTSAEFKDLSGIAVDSSGNVYVSDYFFGIYQSQSRAMIRKITPDGVVSTLAGGRPGYNDGNGVGAGFDYPQGLAVDAGGNVYVADSFGIRIVSPDGTVTTWAGSQNNEGTDVDGVGANAGFYDARAIALDRAGGAYVVDEPAYTIRYVAPGGVVTTVAGLAGTYAGSSNDGVGSAARFLAPYGIAVDAAGNVDISDISGATILKGALPALSPIGSVSESAGIAPIRSSNPWQFTAVYAELVSDLRLRVQSTLTTNVEGSWADLPGSLDMTDVDGNWNLNATYVPGGNRWFRVIAAAPGYVDRASPAVGPENVLQGIAPFGSFTWQTTTPYRSGASWTFTMVETPVVPGLSLRVQSSMTSAVGKT